MIKKYGERCCRVRSNGKARIFNTESGSHESATKDTHERGLPELLQRVARTMG